MGCSACRVEAVDGDLLAVLAEPAREIELRAELGLVSEAFTSKSTGPSRRAASWVL